jgi:hypothetical protein
MIAVGIWRLIERDYIAGRNSPRLLESSTAPSSNAASSSRSDSRRQPTTHKGDRLVAVCSNTRRLHCDAASGYSPWLRSAGLPLAGPRGHKDTRSPTNPLVSQPWKEDPRRNIGINLEASDLTLGFSVQCKHTSAVESVSTGSPFCSAGLYRHCFAACSADSKRSQSFLC